MKENSNIRRIDELGRIVIPKDIRKKLHIKNNEPLEIFIENSEIKIKKYSSLPELIEYIKFLIDTCNRITDNNYIITDKEHILASNQTTLNDISLNKELETILETSKDEANIPIDIIIEDERIIGKSNIVPIIIDNDRAGLIIEYNTEINSNYIIKLLKKLIEEKLNI